MLLPPNPTVPPPPPAATSPAAAGGGRASARIALDPYTRPFGKARGGLSAPMGSPDCGAPVRVREEVGRGGGSGVGAFCTDQEKKRRSPPSPSPCARVAMMRLVHCIPYVARDSTPPGPTVVAQILAPSTIPIHTKQTTRLRKAVGEILPTIPLFGTDTLLAVE